MNRHSSDSPIVKMSTLRCSASRHDLSAPLRAERNGPPSSSKYPCRPRTAPPPAGTPSVTVSSTVPTISSRESYSGVPRLRVWPAHRATRTGCSRRRRTPAYTADTESRSAAARATANGAVRERSQHHEVAADRTSFRNSLGQISARPSDLTRLSIHWNRTAVRPRTGPARGGPTRVRRRGFTV